MELLGIEHVSHVADGDEQDPPPESLREQLGLGVAPREALDTRGIALEPFGRFLSGQKVKAVSDPVLVARRLVAEPFLVDPLEEPARRRTEDRAESEA